MSVKDILKIVFGILGGVLTRKLSTATLKKLLEGLSLGNQLKKLYLDFPDSPSGYDAWIQKADAIWKKVGKMA